MKNTILIFCIVSAVTASQVALASETTIKFSNNRQRHTELATAQVILATGCEGRLGLREKSHQGKLTGSDRRSIQVCTDNASTDIFAGVQSDLASGKIDQSRLTLQVIHESVLFAKAGWAPLRPIPTEKIIAQARLQANRLYPFPGSSK
jgi:hypothetical protein